MFELFNGIDEFTTSYVCEVSTTDVHPPGSGPGDKPTCKGSHCVNAIKVVKHWDKTVNYSDSTECGQSPWYIPLLRGITDTPTQGDFVISIGINDVNYYLGPLNGKDNNPNFNEDVVYARNKPDTEKLNYKSGGDSTTTYNKYFGINPDFSRENIPRLQTPINAYEYLNAPSGKKSNPATNRSGNMNFEGRFGNSIRIGHNGNIPNIVLSVRGGQVPYDTPMDSCFISMTKRGNINDSFNISGFTLPSNNKKLKNKRLLEYKGEYDNSQITILSGRLLFGSVSNRLILSSYSDTEIGSGNDLRIYTKGSTIIESKNIYLGEKAKDSGESMVLGDSLKKFLEGVIDRMALLTAMATIGGSSAPLKSSPAWASVELLKLDLTNCISDKHKIEKNGPKQ